MRRLRAGVSLLVTAAVLGAHAANAGATAIPFSSSAAEATLRAEILTKFPGALFPAAEGRLCPETYTRSEGEYSVCYAEFQTESTWHLEGGEAELREGMIAVTLSTRAHWLRAWVSCQLPRAGLGAPGTLTSNYNCGRHQVSDAYLVAVEIYPSIRTHRAVRAAGWQFTESAGFTSLGDFRAKKRRATYVFTNAVSDSFRYTP